MDSQTRHHQDTPCALPHLSYKPNQWQGRARAGKTEFWEAESQKTCPAAAPAAPLAAAAGAERCSVFSTGAAAPGAKKNARSYKKSGEQRHIHGQLQGRRCSRAGSREQPRPGAAGRLQPRPCQSPGKAGWVRRARRCIPRLGVGRSCAQIPAPFPSFFPAPSSPSPAPKPGQVCPQVPTTSPAHAWNFKGPGMKTIPPRDFQPFLLLRLLGGRCGTRTHPCAPAAGRSHPELQKPLSATSPASFPAFLLPQAPSVPERGRIMPIFMAQTNSGSVCSQECFLQGHSKRQNPLPHAAGFSFHQAKNKMSRGLKNGILSIFSFCWC